MSAGSGGSFQRFVRTGMTETHAGTVADAWHKLYFLERACESQVLAQSTGSPLRLATEDVARHTARQWNATSEAAAPALFAAVRRQLDRAQP